MAVTVIYETAKGTVGGLELDATLSTRHRHEVEVTEHPVESGATVSDHRRPKAAQVTIEGVITATPFKTALPAQAQKDRPQSEYERLLRFKDTTELVTVLTERETYRDMSLVELETTEGDKRMDVLHFTATFKQVRLVTLAWTTTRFGRTTRHARAKPEEKQGPKVPEPPTAGDKAAVNETMSRTLGYRLADWMQGP